MSDLVETIRACALAHRRGERMGGAEQLVAIIDALQQVMILEPSAARRDRFEAVAETITEAQQRGDVLTVADALEYELAPLLGGEPPDID